MHMQGPAQNFYFMPSQDLYLVYAMSTMDGADNMTYLKPQDDKHQDSGAIIAVAQTQVPFIFRVTPQPEVPFVFPS